MTKLPNRISVFREIIELKSGDLTSTNSLDIGTDNRRNPPGTVAVSQEEIENGLEALSEWAKIYITMVQVGESGEETLYIHSPQKKLKIFSLNGSRNTAKTLVKNADISASATNSKWQVYENCRILNLTISQDCRSAIIKNCKIGRLNLPAKAENLSIQIEDSHVCQLLVPRTFDASDFKIQQCSFSGSLERSSLIIGDTVRTLPRLDRQSFSNLLNWASNVGNSEVAHIARGNELRIETVEAKGIEKAFLLIWWCLGDYGLSPGRPLKWLIIITIALFAVLMFQGTVVSIPAVAKGWQSALIDGVGSDNAYKSAVATLNNLISPWSFLSPRRIVQPATSLGIVATGIHSALTVILVLLTGFSLRRRFRFS